MDPDRGCWRALQELVAGGKPGTPASLMAKRLNVWGNDAGDCWRPTSFHLTAADIKSLAGALSSEKECWRVFREMVEEAIPEISKAPVRRM